MSITKRMDVQMSDDTLKLELAIRNKTGVTNKHSREKILREGIEKLHKRLFKTNSVLANLASTKNE